MKCDETTMTEDRETQSKTEPRAQTNQGVINLPLGLLGFEKHKRYVLLASNEEAPFLWLQMADEPRLSFLVVSASEVARNYQPDISEDEAKFLGLRGAEDAWVFNIVTVHPDGHATVNLKGPIVVNKRTLTGKQIIPLNATLYSLQHPINASSQPTPVPTPALHARDRAQA